MGFLIVVLIILGVVGSMYFVNGTLSSKFLPFNAINFLFLSKKDKQLISQLFEKFKEYPNPTVVEQSFWEDWRIRFSDRSNSKIIVVTKNKLEVGLESYYISPFFSNLFYQKVMKFKKQKIYSVF